MKTPITIAVLALHVAIVTMILVQPGCKSSEENINPDLTAAEETPEVPVAVEGSLPPEGSANLRAAPTRPVYALPQRGSVNEVPVDTFVQPEDELIAPSTTTIEPELIEPKETSRPFVSTAPSQTSTLRYTVKRGDNLTKIAKAHDTTVNAIMEANGLARNTVLQVGKTIVIPVSGTSAPASVSAAEPQTAGVQSATYVVQKGDSLSKIAGKFNTSVGKIMSANGMNTTAIRIGQKLKIPTGTPSATVAAVASGDALTHKVGNGETLGGIANKYKVSLKSLMELNGIKDPRKLRAGQTLVIRKDGSSAPQAASAAPTVRVESPDPAPAAPVVKPDAAPAPAETVPSSIPAEALTPAPTPTVDVYDL